jgi:hypothetical protein
VPIVMHQDWLHIAQKVRRRLANGYIIGNKRVFLDDLALLPAGVRADLRPEYFMADRLEVMNVKGVIAICAPTILEALAKAPVVSSSPPPPHLSALTDDVVAALIKMMENQVCQLACPSLTLLLRRETSRTSSTGLWRPILS